MSPADQIRSLSWGDTFFLYLERDGQPLNIASTCEFEGKITLQACARFIESKLDIIPRYKQRAVFPPFNLGLPTWEFDPNFDIRNHVREIVLKQGTDSDLKAEAARIISSQLDRNHPLWDITLVRGLMGNRTGMIIRLHHCMADGVSGVGIMNVLLDATPTPQKPARKKPPVELPGPTDSVAILLDRFLKSYQSFMQGALTAQTEVLNIARDLFAGAAHGQTEELIHLVPELGTPSERLPFNKVCRGPQQLAWAEIPMAEIKAVRAILAGTVNDVVLTTVTSAVRCYSESLGVKLRGRHVRLIVPVNIRGKGDVSELGNQITFLPINVPLDVRDPRILLSRVSERMTFLRSVGVPELVGLFGTLVSKVPLPLQAVLVPLLTQLPLSLCNMICTNIPGPQVPLYMLGHKLLRCYPYVPIGGELGLNVAILSYDGTAYFGFGGDVHAVPDIDRFEELLRESFQELRAAAAAYQHHQDVSENQAGDNVTPKPSRSRRATVEKQGPKPKIRSASPTKRVMPKRHSAAKTSAAPFPPTASQSMANAENTQAGD
ncbi:MAG: wax ester/triacylglycerol synthase family O-acyltransferase [Candidatus Korobacteraceae bacterium]